jgi:cobalamin biosynthesis Mg chelatase CobN
MRFIGELYKKDLISAGTIKESCLDRLIQSSVEEELTCMCKLFQTIGAKLENYYTEKSKQKKKSKLKSIFPDYFDQIQALAKDHPSSRVRFMLYDLVEMRNNNWTARREGEKMVSLNDKNHPSAQSSSTTTTHATTTAPASSSSSSSSTTTTATSGPVVPVVVEPVVVVVPEPVKPVVSEADEWNEVGTTAAITTSTNTSIIIIIIIIMILGHIEAQKKECIHSIS